MHPTGTFTGYAAVQEYLFSLKAKGVKFGVDRMRLLVEALEHPERRYPVIHVAGTNGKGSVSAMPSQKNQQGPHRNTQASQIGICSPARHLRGQVPHGMSLGFPEIRG